jgi:hypothetical protein
MKIETLKDTIQDCNLNFLLGSGLSCPFLTALGNIEALLTELETAALDERSKKIIRASLYKKYFDTVIIKNLNILQGDPDTAAVLENYKTFLRSMNSILIKRKVTILSKEINLFTTNVDVFLEKALEELSLEFNDGFNGRFRPTFSLSNFKISRYTKSLFYDKTAQLPVFNLMKLHGSLSWDLDANSSIVFSVSLRHITEVAARALPTTHCIEVPEGATIPTLSAGLAGKRVDGTTDAFLNAYEKLLIVVNPTKDKFRHTVMNQTYYELLRQYSNELEKENTILFVMGFSFCDEHIREITIRAANSNPTLMIYVIAYTSEASKKILALIPANALRNNNIETLTPEQEDDGHGHLVDKFKYDFMEINRKIFGEVLTLVNSKN